MTNTNTLRPSDLALATYGSPLREPEPWLFYFLAFAWGGLIVHDAD